MDLKEADVADIYADFKFSEDGKQIIFCSVGHEPKSNVYDSNTQKNKVSFSIGQYKGSPYFAEYKSQLPVRVATIKLAKYTSHHAEQQRSMKQKNSKNMPDSGMEW